MVKNCPYCGASLHEEASFCPYCAKSVNQRKQPHPPRYISGRALWSAGVLLAVLVLVLLAVFWYRLRPRVYDNDSTEVIYRDQGVDYQLCIAWANAPFTPADRVRQSSAPLDKLSRYPVLLYINLAGTETFAADTFLELVESITGEISGADPEIQITCSEAVRDTDHVPNSAAILYMNPMVTSSGPHSAELTISVRMKNGDIIRLHQTQTMEGIITHHFTSDDTPLNTVNDLEVLLARLDEMVGPEDKVYIHLPPVTYTEELFVSGRAINFTGSTDEAGNRTTFTAPIRVESERDWVFFWEGFDLLGSGEGTGLSAAARISQNPRDLMMAENVAKSDCLYPLVPGGLLLPDRGGRAQSRRQPVSGAVHGPAEHQNGLGHRRHLRPHGGAAEKGKGGQGYRRSGF